MIIRTILAAFALMLPAWAAAQDPYPNRPIEMIVPYPPGGQADLSARPLAAALQPILGQPVVVINKPGASGAIGNRAVANGKPDGYTILVTLVSITTIPEVDKMFGRKPAYAMEDFAPLARLAADPPVLVVGAGHPWKSVKELVADAKSRPDDIVYSHSGLYGPSHLPMEMFLHAAGIKMRGLPAVGGGPTMQLVLGGSSAMWASPPAMAVPQVSAQKLRALASFGAERHPAFPEVPTLQELGYDVEFYVWSGAFAHAETPPAILGKLRDSIGKAVASDLFQNALAKMKTPNAYLDAAAFRDFLRKDGARLSTAVKQIGKVQ